MDTGFSFKNLRGHYYCEDGFIKFDNEDEIVDVYKNVVNSTAQPIFLEFASIDANQDEKIIDFCAKYGRIGVSDNNKKIDAEFIEKENIVTPHLHFEQFRQLHFKMRAPSNTLRLKTFGESNVKFYDTFECIQDYKDSIRLMRAVISIKENIESGYYVQAFKEYIVANIIGTFNNTYSYGYPEYIASLGTYKLEDVIYRNFSDLFNEPDFFTKNGDRNVTYSDFCEYDSVNDALVFQSECILSDMIADIPEQSLKSLFLGCALDIVNYYVHSVRPAVTIVNQSVQGFWKANSLLSAMYMELFLSLSANIKVRQCSNKTCGNFFRIEGNDTRKIYCSNSCAQLEAKRKQRERQKAKTSPQSGEVP